LLIPAAVQTDRVTGGLSRALALGVLTLVLVGCSDDSQSPGSDDSQSSSASTSEPGSDGPSDSLLVPDGVELTDQGSSLELGETATVAYEVRQGVVGVLDITVTRLEKTSFADSFVGWDLDDETKTTKPYFVRATVTNRGETDLGEVRLQPLYILDAADTLVESTLFGSTFKPCHPDAFPAPFQPGTSVDLCLVYLTPNKGDLVAASFRPTETDIPITWTGEVTKPEPPKPAKDDKGKGKNRTS
jgi:hypothetical protein